LQGEFDLKFGIPFKNSSAKLDICFSAQRWLDAETRRFSDALKDGGCGPGEIARDDLMPEAAWNFAVRASRGGIRRL